MKVGIPKGLLYYKYYPFFESFFRGLGAEVVVSPDTNKEILDAGVSFCVDEACLPMKIFHGHVAYLRDKCDILLIPRIMQLRKREFICPKFCGLPEMVINSVPDMPKTITTPFYATSYKSLYSWAKEAGGAVTKNPGKIKRALETAIKEQGKFKSGFENQHYNINIAFAGHPYNIYDTFTNMNLVKKLNQLEIGVMTEENVEEEAILNEVSELYKKPFWTFARNTFGFTTSLYKRKAIDGIIYISSFACGPDSIIIELIKNKIDNFPLMVLKVDEQTGEAGFNTRIEAFADMLERRKDIEDNVSAYGECAVGSKNFV